MILWEVVFVFVVVGYWKWLMCPPPHAICIDTRPKCTLHGRMVRSFCPVYLVCSHTAPSVHNIGHLITNPLIIVSLCILCLLQHLLKPYCYMGRETYMTAEPALQQGKLL